MRSNDSPLGVSALETLRPKAKAPNSCRTLDAWVNSAERELGVRGGRVGWLVATTLVSAKLQQVLDEAGGSRFALKGGTLLQYRLGLETRATRDLDGIVSGDMEEFVMLLRRRLGEPWGAVEFSMTDPEPIDVPSKVVKPMRFHVACRLRGQTWRSVKVEISPEEGRAGTPRDEVAPAPLDRFGLPVVDSLVGVAMAYQVAEKLHGATEPDDPPAYENDRVRDVVDLVLMKRLIEDVGSPSDSEIAHAVEDIFSSRALEAELQGTAVRRRPSLLRECRRWASDYPDASASAGLDMSLSDAIDEVNAWLVRIGVLCDE